MAESNRESAEGWAIVELMGHRRVAGYVRETTVAGAPMLRVDVPAPTKEGKDRQTQFYAPSSIYALTPTTEETARRVAALGAPKPVQEWELPTPRALPAPAGARERDDEATDGVDGVPF